MKIYKIYDDGELLFEGDEGQLFDNFGMYPNNIGACCEANSKAHGTTWTYEEEEDDWNG